MYLHIQYQYSDQSWSPWIACCLKGNHLMINGKEMDTKFVRVLKNQNYKNPDVAWWVRHEQALYEIKKNATNTINKATPLFHQKHTKPIALNRIVGDFSLEAFELMKKSAEDYLAPPLFDPQFIQDALIRPADNTQTMVLAGIETQAQQTESWWKDLYERYRQLVQAQLIQIIACNTSKTLQIDALSQFLDAHYQFIQGTCLDYVAIPHHPVTTTMTKIAEKIAHETNIPAIELLMPGIAIHNIKNGQPNLTQLPLPFVLQSHIFLKKNYLASVQSLIDKVNAPDEQAYSGYTTTNYFPQALLPSDIQALYQHSSMTQALYDAFCYHQSLITQNSHLLGQLRILGIKMKMNDAHDGIGQQDEAGSLVFTAIKDFMQYYLSLEPCHLLFKNTPPSIKDLPENQHLGYVFYQDKLYFLNAYEKTVSPITSPLHRGKYDIHLARLQNLDDVPDTLPMPAIVQTPDGQFTFFPGKKSLPRLMLQCINYHFSSRIIHFTDTNIPETVFNAIAATGFKGPLFVDLFHKKFSKNTSLDQEDLAWIENHTGHSFMKGYSRIPKPLRDEIQLLWQLCHNPSKNIDATTNMATCIGTRGEVIRHLSKQYESELLKISLSSEHQGQIIEEARIKQQSCLQELKTSLERQTYEGHDQHLSLNFDILVHLQKSINIQSLFDVYSLSTFSPQDLKVLLESNPELLTSLKRQLNHKEHFVIYLSDTPANILEVILPHIGKLFNACVKQFPAFLSMLSPSKLDIIIQKSHHLILYYSTFINIYQCLSPDMQDQFFASFQERWKPMIKNGIEFNFVYTKLAPAHQNHFFNTLCGHEKGLIAYLFDFKLIYKTVRPHHQEQLFNILYGNVRGLIQYLFDFEPIYKTVNPDHKKKLFHIFKEHWQDFIQDGYDFGSVYAVLSPNHQEQLIEVFQNDWKAIVKDADTFVFLYEKLRHQHQNQLIQAFQGHWQILIQETCEWEHIYVNLSYEHQTQLFMSLLGQELNGQLSIKDSIKLLIYVKRPSWADHNFFEHLFALHQGIRALKRICSLNSIEIFLQALLSQHSEQIASAAELLQASIRKPIFSCFSPNHQMFIPLMLHSHFARYMAPPLLEEPQLYIHENGL